MNQQAIKDVTEFLKFHSLDDAYQMWLDNAPHHWQKDYWRAWVSVCNSCV